MTILLFLLVPMILVGAYALYGWLRTREPSSVESGVDAFRREMSALSPDAAPSSRRPEPEPRDPADPADGAPRAERPDRPGRAGPAAPPAAEHPEPRQTPRRPGTPGPEADR